MSWYKRQAKKHHLDIWITEQGGLARQDRQLDRFPFFRDRLIILKMYYDEARPQTWRQFWYDRRNGVQFFTIVNATIVTIFTLVTIIFGLVQIALASAQLKKSE
jgi:hypothetical protein